MALAAAAPAWAVKTDVLVFHNGDRLTGEVKDLSRGILTFKTDELGTLSIEWDSVASVTAAATFEIELLTGDRIYGSLQAGPYAGALAVVTMSGVRNMDALAVARIARLGATLWGRIDGSIDLGTSYTSSSELFQFDLSAVARYERPGYEINSNLALTLSTQPEVEDTQRANLGLGFLGRFPHRWFWFGDGLAEQNRELGFELRASLASGLGRYLVKSPRDDLQTALGVSVNRERPTTGDVTTNTELVLNLGYNRFSYDFPRLEVYLNLSTYQNVDEWGRTRVELDAKIRREMLKDFYVTLRGYESYDSRPATEGAPNHSFGLTFALGWSF